MLLALPHLSILPKATRMSTTNPGLVISTTSMMGIIVTTSNILLSRATMEVSRKALNFNSPQTPITAELMPTTHHLPDPRPTSKQD